MLLLTLHQVVSTLYRGRDISWIQAAYLYPAFTLLLIVATSGCAAVLGTRLLRSAQAMTAAIRMRNAGLRPPADDSVG